MREQKRISDFDLEKLSSISRAYLNAKREFNKAAKDRVYSDTPINAEISMQLLAAKAALKGQATVMGQFIDALYQGRLNDTADAYIVLRKVYVWAKDNSQPFPSIDELEVALGYKEK